MECLFTNRFDPSAYDLAYDLAYDTQCNNDEGVITKILESVAYEGFDFVYIDNQLKSIGHLLIVVCSCQKRACSEHCCQDTNTTLKECEQFYPYQFWNDRKTEQMCESDYHPDLVEFEIVICI